MEKLGEQREAILQQIRNWGGASSDALLDPACKLFSIPEKEGVIGYRSAYGCAVVYGDPVCPREQEMQLTQAFHDFSQSQGWQVIYIMASLRFATEAMKGICKASMQFGEECLLDPYRDPRHFSGPHACLLRRKLKHAAHEGITTHEYKAVEKDAALEAEIEQLAEHWLKNRRGPQAYISHVRLFQDRIGKRWFYAKEKGGQVVGVVVLNALEERQGWLMNRLMHAKEASGGTPESLVMSALETLAKEECRFVTCGTLPAQSIEGVEGLSTLSATLSRYAFRFAHRILHLDGHGKFWEKFQPETQNLYLLLSRPHLGVRELLALMHAMNVGWM